MGEIYPNDSVYGTTLPDSDEIRVVGKLVKIERLFYYVIDLEMSMIYQGINSIQYMIVAENILI